MAFQFSVPAINAALDSVETVVGASPVVEIRSGTLPADCASADTGSLLASVALPVDWMAPAVDKVKELSGLWRADAALISGTAAYFRLRAAGVCHIQGVVTATGGGGDIELSTASITQGAPVEILSFYLNGQTDVVTLPQLTVALLGASQGESDVDTVTWTARVTASMTVPVGGCSCTWTVSGTGANPANAADFGGAFPTGTATLSVGQTYVDVTFTSSGDTTVETDETFAVTLSSPVNCTVGGSPAVGTIVNDDVPPPPPVTFASINAEGWTVDYASDFTVDTPILDDVVVNRAAFNALGQAIVRPYSLKTTRRRLDGVLTRNPMLRRVALSDYLYEGDVITGATGASVITSPKPIVKWADEDRLVIGNSASAAVAASHRDAGERLQVACAKFIWTDSANNTVTAIASAPTATAHSSWWRQCPVWQVSGVDLSGLLDGPIRRDVEVYPRFGTAASVFKSADVPSTSYWLCRSVWFRKNPTKAAAPPIAVVKYGGAGTIEGVAYGTPSSSGVVSTNPATARANPFDTISSAQQALMGATYAAITGQDLGGCEIYIAGSPTGILDPLHSVAITTSGYALTIRRDPLLTKDACFIPSLSGRLRHTAGRATELDAWRVRLVGLKAGRDNTSSAKGVSNYTSGSTPLDCWMVDCEIDHTGDPGTALSGSLTRGMTFWGCRHTGDGGVVFTARYGTANSQGAIAFYGTRAVAAAAETNLNNLEAVTHIASEFVGYNKADARSERGNYEQFISWHTTYFKAWRSGTTLFAINACTNAAWVNGLVEAHGGSDRIFRISGDDQTGSTDHNILHNFTVAGRGAANGGMNNWYDDVNGLHRIHQRHSVKGCVTQSLAFKGGEQASPQDAANDGAFPHGHGVGHRDNFQAGSTGFAKRYPGVGFLGSESVNTDPMFVDAAQWANSTWGDTSATGLGMGNYRPASGSPLRGAVSDALTSHDLDMAVRPLTGDTIGCYV